MKRASRRWIVGVALCASAVLLHSAGYARAYVSAFPNLDDFKDGFNVSGYLGAGRFYASGFAGSSAIVANIESGRIWSSHETLTHVQPIAAASDALNEFDRHATWVGMVLGGRPTVGGGEYQRGMAYGATLWSGVIATVYVGQPYRRSFDYSVQSLATPYKAALIDGVDGRTADVVNSSFSDASDPAAGTQGDFSRVVDAIAALSGKTIVGSAGNTGASNPPVPPGVPASGFNTIAVASLGNELTVPPYDNVSNTSSRGPSPIFIPSIARAASVADGTLIANARAVVDIAAPGENIVTANYGGTTGGNAGGTDFTNGATDNYINGISGTSFAAPSVAGGATLIADAARRTFGDNTRALDGRATKAILLNSADKIGGWNNAQVVGGDNVIRTTQALDYASGAGRMNLNKAYDQLFAGTADVIGDGGSVVRAIGWDVGRVVQGTPNDYAIASPLLVGSTLTVTLDWFADRSIDFTKLGAEDATSEVSFDDLTLQVCGATGGLVAESVSAYNEVEHLSFALPASDTYWLRVVWAGEVWDFADDVNATTYGLAWAGTVVPEPTTMFAVLAGLGVRRRRQR